MAQKLYELRRFSPQEEKEFFRGMRQMEKAVASAMDVAAKKVIIDEIKSRLHRSDPRIEALEEIENTSSKKRKSDLWRHYKQLRRRYG